MNDPDLRRFLYRLLRSSNRRVRIPCHARESRKSARGVASPWLTGLSPFRAVGIGFTWKCLTSRRKPHGFALPVSNSAARTSLPRRAGHRCGLLIRLEIWSNCSNLNNIWSLHDQSQVLEGQTVGHFYARRSPQGFQPKVSLSGRPYLLAEQPLRATSLSHIG